jgi:hypothetical protein
MVARVRRALVDVRSLYHSLDGSPSDVSDSGKTLDSARATATGFWTAGHAGRVAQMEMYAAVYGGARDARPGLDAHG